MTNGKLKAFFVVIVTTVLFFVVLTAYAAMPVHGEGIFKLTGQNLIDERKAGSNLIINQELTFYNSGVLNGPSVATVTCIVGSGGEANCTGSESFKGTLDGKLEGALLFNVVVRIDKTGALEGRWTVIDGSGDLANLHGTGSLAGTTAVGTYTLDYTLVP